MPERASPRPLDPAPEGGSDLSPGNHRLRHDAPDRGSALWAQLATRGGPPRPPPEPGTPAPLPLHPLLPRPPVPGPLAVLLRGTPPSPALPAPSLPAPARRHHGGRRALHPRGPGRPHRSGPARPTSGLLCTFRPNFEQGRTGGTALRSETGRLRHVSDHPLVSVPSDRPSFPVFLPGPRYGVRARSLLSAPEAHLDSGGRELPSRLPHTRIGGCLMAPLHHFGGLTAQEPY